MHDNSPSQHENDWGFFNLNTIKTYFKKTTVK